MTMEQSKLTRRHFLRCAAVAGASVFATACAAQQPAASTSAGPSPVPAAPEPVKLVWWMWPTNDQHVPQQFPALQETIPNVDFEVIAAPGGEMRNKLQAALVAGSGAPDLTLIEISWMGQFRNLQGGLVNLDPYIQASDPELLNRFFAAPVEAAKSPEGHQIALPKEFGPGVMFYRVELLEQAGLPTDPDEVAQLIPTWDAFIDIAGESIAQRDEVWLFANANDVLRHRRNQLGWLPVIDGRPNLQAPEVEEALNLAKRYYDGGYTSQLAWGDSLFSAFSGGKIAFLQNASFWTSILKHAADQDGAGKWRMTHAADGPFGEGGDFYAITEQAQDKDLAYKVIEWFATDPRKFAYSWKQDLSPGAYRPNFENDPSVQEPIEYLGGQVVGDIVARSAAGLIPQAIHQDDAKVISALGTVAEQVFRGEIGIAEGLATAQQQAERDMGV